jgi:quercetin dioxygenase-like cupin family protein
MFISTANLLKRDKHEGVGIREAWGEKIMMSFVDLAPHSTVLRHSHPQEQMGVVLEGEFELTIAQDSRLLKKGDAYLIPSGVAHSVRVMKSQSYALDIFSPPREDYK